MKNSKKKKKMVVWPKATHRVYVISIKIPASLFIELEKAIISRKNPARGITLPEFKLYFRAIVTNVV